MLDLSMEVEASLVSITSMLVWIPISRDILLSLSFAESAFDVQIRFIHSRSSPWQSWCTEQGSPASNEFQFKFYQNVVIEFINPLTHRFATTYIFRSFVKIFWTFAQRFLTNNRVSVVSEEAVSILKKKMDEVSPEHESKPFCPMSYTSLINKWLLPEYRDCANRLIACIFLLCNYIPQHIRKRQYILIR